MLAHYFDEATATEILTLPLSNRWPHNTFFGGSKRTGVIL